MVSVNLFKNKQSELLLISLMFVIFFQLISDFVETIFSLNLITVSLNENVLGVLFILAPIILIFYGKNKEVTKKSLIILGEIIIICRILESFLILQAKMIAAGIGVGCFLIFLPVFIKKKIQDEDEQTGLLMGLGLAFALIILICLKTVGSSFDITLFFLLQWISWILLVVFAVVLYCVIMTMEKQEYSDNKLVPNTKSDKDIQQSSPWKIAGLTIGIISIILMIYFAFSSPTVFSRWTEANYIVIVIILVSVNFIFIYVALFKPDLISRINRRNLLLWNGIFISSLTISILLNQLLFPPYYEEYPIFVRPSTTLEVLIFQIPLYLMLFVSPIILIDFTILSRELVLCKPSLPKLGKSFTLASIFFILMIFAIIFTITYDYIPVIGPFFRDGLWYVFLVIGLGITLSAILVKEKTMIFYRNRLHIYLKNKILISSLIGILCCATAVSAIMLESYPSKPSGSVDSITIFSYNIQQGFDKYGEKNFEGQLEVIKNADADIIGLVESDLARISSGNSDFVRFVANELNLYSYYGPKTTIGNYGVALLSKYPIKNAKTFYMYSIGEQTATIEAKIKIKHTTYNIFVTHLGNFDDPSQRSQIITIIDQVKHKDNVILMGDFNFEHDENRYNMTIEELNDCWEIAGDSNGGFKMKDRVDHVFVSDDLTGKVDECNYLGGDNSDHPAVSVEIDI